MTFFGITLRKPSFNEFTGATVMGIGVWLASVGMMKASGHPIGLMEAGAGLLLMVWACVGVRFGINVSSGVRHLVANVVVSILLLGLYEAAWALAA